MTGSSPTALSLRKIVIMNQCLHVSLKRLVSIGNSFIFFHGKEQ